LSYGSVEAITAHTDRLKNAKEMAEKTGKMELVEKAHPQAEFAKSVGLSVSTRREAAEAKHRARIARER